VLAAGAARRFGTLKQLASWRGIPLVAHVAQQALACPDISQVIVTTGAEGERLREALAAARVDLPEAGSVRVPWPINVPDWAEGQSRSVQAGLDAALTACNGKLAAVLYLLADQPRITPELLAALIQRHRETLAPIVAPRHDGQRGNPVLFDRSTFADFAGLTGDVGARSIIRQRENEVAWVDWPSGEIFQDIDTPDDYAGAEQGI